jgi:hypothetical protein
VIRIPKNIYQIKQTAEGYFSITSTGESAAEHRRLGVLPNGTSRLRAGAATTASSICTRRHVVVVPEAAVRLAATRRRRTSRRSSTRSRDEHAPADVRLRRVDDSLGDMYNKPVPVHLQGADSFTPQQD